VAVAGLEPEARLHRGVNDLQLLKDWMGLRDYCFRPSTGLDHPQYPPHYYIHIFKNIF
jgi:hypothetical protein